MPSYLRREGNHFLFRRRVPEHLQQRIGCQEIYRSLGTAVRRVANQRAAALFLASETLFSMAQDTTLSTEDIRAAARLWLSQDHWKARLARSVDGLLPGVLRDEQPELPERMYQADSSIDDDVPPDEVRRMGAYFALENAGYHPPFERPILEKTADVIVSLLRDYVDRRMQEVFRPEDIRTAPSGPLTSSERQVQPCPSARLSEHVEDWLKAAQKGLPDRKAISAHCAGQYRVSTRLAIELIGDKPIREITRKDAEELRLNLLQLPSSHGKGKYVHAREAIAKAAANGSELMILKTVKRHFSALNGYWSWLRRMEYLGEQDASPFLGHRFPGTKSSRTNRDDWSAADLERFFRSPQYDEFPEDTAEHWLPLLALYSGMRLEEMCRLRTDHDLEWQGDCLCIIVQPHPDGWDPKSEAGERTIPVHPRLIEHGFLDLIERRKAEGAFRLFSDLQMSSNGKLGASYSREFSRLKQKLGIGRKTVFHSFRHTFRTVLESTDIKDSHIDAIMGHEGDKKSEGRTYTKRVSLAKRIAVVNEFISPLPLDFLDAGKRTSRRHRRPERSAKHP